MSAMGASQVRAERRSLSLATKMVLLSAGLSGALAVLLTWFGYAKAQAGLRNKSELALTSEAQLTSMMIEDWMNDRIVGLRGVAGLRSVRTVLDTAASLAREDVDLTNEALANIAAVAPEIELIQVISLRGEVVASTSDETPAEPLLDRPEVERAVEGGEFIGGIEISPVTQAPCTYTAVPARGSNGTVVGVVRARESIKRMQALVGAVRRRIGPDAQAVLLDARGLVVGSTADKMPSNRPLSEVAPALAAQIAKGTARGFRWDYEQRSYDAVSMVLQRPGWRYAAALPLKEIDRAAREFLFTASIAAALGVLLALALSAIQARRMVASLARLSEVSHRVVTEGDLTQTVEIHGDDEIGELARHFGIMVEALREALNGLRRSAHTLEQAAENLNDSTREQEQLLAQQIAALQHTQVTGQEIRQTSLMANGRADQVLQMAEHAEQVGRAGEVALENGVQGFSAIRGEAVEIGDRIRTLLESAKRIGGITSTVKDLADQSNMLALNAAIEAVRSGEHGRGFAVVAREIRSLADQSITATRQVNQILVQLTASISLAVTTTEAGMTRMERGLDDVRASGDNLRELAAITRTNVDAVRQIAEAVSEQDTGIAQIFSAVTNQLDLVEKTRDRLERTAHASRDLREVANAISRSIERYRT
jgi:methyl-accepting chemotaxis protein